MNFIYIDWYQKNFRRLSSKVQNLYTETNTHIQNYAYICNDYNLKNLTEYNGCIWKNWDSAEGWVGGLAYTINILCGFYF